MVLTFLLHSCFVHVVSHHASTPTLVVGSWSRVCAFIVLQWIPIAMMSIGAPGLGSAELPWSQSPHLPMYPLTVTVTLIGVQLRIGLRLHRQHHPSTTCNNLTTTAQDRAPCLISTSQPESSGRVQCGMCIFPPASQNLLADCSVASCGST